MGRPPLDNPRAQQLKLSLTLEEYAAIRARAEAAGQRPSSYVRAAILGVAPVAAPAARFDRLVFQQWLRVGNNLNQMARQLHSFERADARDVAAVLDDLRNLIAAAKP